MLVTFIIIEIQKFKIQKFRSESEKRTRQLNAEENLVHLEDLGIAKDYFEKFVSEFELFMLRIRKCYENVHQQSSN